MPCRPVCRERHEASESHVFDETESGAYIEIRHPVTTSSIAASTCSLKTKTEANICPNETAPDHGSRVFQETSKQMSKATKPMYRELEWGQTMHYNFLRICHACVEAINAMSKIQ
jgi:hypothetical protein